MKAKRLALVGVLVLLGGLLWIPATANAAPPWIRQKSGTEVHLHGIFALSGCRAWAVGEETGDSSGQAVILVTGDGGAHWAPQPFPAGSATGTTMNRVMFTENGEIGYAVGENNNFGSGDAGKPNFLRTTDGGTTWVDLSSRLPSGTNAPSGSSDIEGLSVRDENVWIAVGNYGAGQVGFIIHSANRGQSWDVQKKYTVNTFDSISMADNHTGWATSNDSKLWRTTNGGANWSIVASTASSAEQVFAVSTTQAVIAEDHGIIEYTTDGTTLSPATVPSEVNGNDFTDIAMGTQGQGFATGEFNGHALGTTDGGVTWNWQTVVSGNKNFNGVTITRGQHSAAWVVGENGGINANQAAKVACK